MPANEAKKIYPRLSEALETKGIAIGADKLEALNGLSNKLDPLGIDVNTTVHVPITNGQGHYNASYPTLWQTIKASLTITSPSGSDVWQISAYDSYSSKSLFNGTVTANNPVNINYKTGAKISLQISAQNLSNPGFNGQLDVAVKASI